MLDFIAHYFKLTSHLFAAVIIFVIVLNLPFISFAQTASPSPTAADKTYAKIQERISKTKDRLQYMYRYASWNDPRTNDYYKKTDLMFNRMLSIGEICFGNKDELKLQECDRQTKRLYDGAKASFRLTKYFAILSGKPNSCVMANLGVKPNRDGTPVEPERTAFGNVAQSLFLCSGPESSAQNLDLRWRVEATDKGMIKIKENYRTEPGNMQNIDNERAAEQFIEEVLNETK